jgi:hypothetical protein
MYFLLASVAVLVPFGRRRLLPTPFRDEPREHAHEVVLSIQLATYVGLVVIIASSIIIWRLWVVAVRRNTPSPYTGLNFTSTGVADEASN